MKRHEPRWRLTVELYTPDDASSLRKHLPVDVAVFVGTAGKVSVQHDLEPNVSGSGMLPVFVDQVSQAIRRSGIMGRIARIEAERIASPLSPPNTWDRFNRGLLEVEPA